MEDETTPVFPFWCPSWVVSSSATERMAISGPGLLSGRGSCPILGELGAGPWAEDIRPRPSPSARRQKGLSDGGFPRNADDGTVLKFEHTGSRGSGTLHSGSHFSDERAHRRSDRRTWLDWLQLGSRLDSRFSSLRLVAPLLACGCRSPTSRFVRLAKNTRNWGNRV